MRRNFHKCLVGPFSLMYGSNSTFPCLFSVSMICSLLRVRYWSSLLLLSIFPLRSVSVCLIYCGAAKLGIYNCSIFLINWPLYHYVLTFSVSSFYFLAHSLCCLILIQLPLLSFGFHLHGIYSYTPLLWDSVNWSETLVWNIYVHAQSCSSLCDAMDFSLAGFSVHGIIPAKVLKWVAISSSRGSSWSRDQTCVSCIGRNILYHLSHLGNPMKHTVEF